MLALLVAQNIAFYVIAALMVFGAIRVVTCKNVVHAALWLVLVLACRDIRVSAVGADSNDDAEPVGLLSVAGRLISKVLPMGR